MLQIQCGLICSEGSKQRKPCSLLESSDSITFTSPKHLLHSWFSLCSWICPCTPESWLAHWFLLKFVACVSVYCLLCVYSACCASLQWLSMVMLGHLCVCVRVFVCVIAKLTQPLLWRSPSGSTCLQGNTSCQKSPEPPSWSPSQWQRTQRWSHRSPVERGRHRGLH